MANKKGKFIIGYSRNNNILEYKFDWSVML